ncbi:MAG: hypothetical protein HYZ28_22960 [Myxococcales bacterium]|nr:hypothetical protein [Myxococcales bacterium]
MSRLQTLWDRARRSRWTGPLLATAFGLIWYCALVGPGTLWPLHIDWLMSGDWSAHLLGWLFFRIEQWQLPLGALSGLLHPTGTSVGYTDSMPWLAVLFKLASPALPPDFQYVGLHLGACFALQGFFGARIAALQSDRPLVQALGGSLFVATPVLLDRLGHDSLCAHWMLLALALFNLRPYASQAERRKTLGWTVGMVVLAAGIHPYLAVMALALALALLVRLSVIDRGTGWMEAALWTFALGLGALAPWYLFGYIGSGTALGVSEFGLRSADLLTLINPAGRSRLFPAFHTGPLQAEGYGYLGSGVVLLTVEALAGVAARWGKAVPRAWARAIPLAAVSLLAAGFALATPITLDGEPILELDWLYLPLESVVAPFRSTGRFIWLLHYLWITAAVLLAIRVFGRERLAAALLGLVLATQVVEVGLAHQAAALEQRPWRRPNLAVWEPARGGYRHLALYPPQVFGACAWIDHDEVIRLSYVAYRLGLTINSGYVARVKEPARVGCLASTKELMSGLLRPDTIYVVDPRAEHWSWRGARCGAVDGVIACVSRANRDPFAALLAHSRG